MKNSMRKMSLCLAVCMLLSGCAAQSKPVNGVQASEATTTTTDAVQTDVSQQAGDSTTRTTGEKAPAGQKGDKRNAGTFSADSGERSPEKTNKEGTLPQAAARVQGNTTARAAAKPTSRPGETITVAGTAYSWLALDASQSGTNRDVQQKLTKVEQTTGVKLQLKQYSEEDLVAACLKANKAGSAVADIINADERAQYRIGSALQDLSALADQKWSLTITRNRKDLAVFPAAYASLCNADLADVQVLFFNKALLKQAGSNEDALYKMVKDGNWTFDAMRKLSKMVTKDVDGKPGMTKDDQWGFSGLAMRSEVTYAIFKAYGGCFTQWDNDRNLKYALGNAKNIASLQLMQTCLLQDTSVYNRGKEDGTIEMFKKGRVLFLSCTLEHQSELSGTNGGWGMVPYPKADKNASYVGTRMSYPLVSPVDGGWSIPAAVKGSRLEKATEVVETIGAQLKKVSLETSGTKLPMTDVVRQSLSMADTDRWVDVYRDMGNGGISTLYYLFDNISNKPATRVKAVQDEAEQRLAKL